MIAAKNTAEDQAKAQGVKRVREMLEGFLPDNERDEDDGGSAPFGKETSVIVNQLACMEAGCPDVEVVCTLLRAKPRPKLMFKIYKAAKDLSSEEVEAAMKKAIAEEAGGGEHEHGHAAACDVDGCDDASHHHAHGHFHDTSVTSVGIERAVELDLRLANAWISTLLQEKGADIFRMKGVLAMAGDGRKYVYQGVHMMMKGEFLDDELWSGDAPRVCRLVFIGKNLKREELVEGFEACVAMRRGVEV